MAYIPQTWTNGAAGGTPLSSARLSYIEEGIRSASAQLGVNVEDYGATGDGTTNDTAAIQAAINATPAGQFCYIPPGYYQFSSLTIPQHVRLVGGGWDVDIDALGPLGDSDYLGRVHYSGTVLLSTATSGNAITVTTSLNTVAGAMQNLLVIGPGSGTSTGIMYGTPPQGIIGPTWHHVGVMNFATGIEMNFVECGVFTNLTVRGCTTGLKLESATNANSFVGMDVQRCVDGVALDATTLSNGFYSPILQANTGTAMLVQGRNHTIVGPYTENPGATRAFDFANAIGCTLDTPCDNNVADTIRIQATSTYTAIFNLAAQIATANSNAGVGTLLHGNLAGFTDTGTRTVGLDVQAGRMSADEFRIGRDATAVDTAMEINAAAGFNRSLSFKTGGALRWVIRADTTAESGSNAGSDLAVVARTDAGASLATMTIRRSDSRIAMPAGATLVTGKGVTGSRPAAATVGLGAQWYDTTLSKPIWSDGTNWRDAAGTVV